MALPGHADFLIVGAGIHGLSSAWGLADRLRARGKEVEGRILVIDKSGIGAGASGIACGVVRNNYYQPAMRRLMQHSVAVWESDPEGLSYHPVGYMQISCEAMHEDVAMIFEQQREVGYRSRFIEGAAASDRYMKEMFYDWQAQNITSVLHELQGGYSNNTKSLYGVARKAEERGARIVTGVEVKALLRESGSEAIRGVETTRGTITCEHLIIAPGPWVRDFWQMMGMPRTITVREPDGTVHENVPMWRYWQLEEGVLRVPPETLLTNDGKHPPVIHVDTDAPLYSCVDGSLITDEMWGIYYKPDWHFGGVQGGAMPYPVERPAEEVAVDPYGPSSPEFVASDHFAHMWVSALAHCHKRFEGMMERYDRHPSGGIGCFTPDSFPVFDHFFGNLALIADSNHGWKMIGVGHLVAAEVLGEPQELLEPFRFDRFEKGNLHPVSHSPYPWS